MRSKLPPIICLFCGFALLIYFFIPALEDMQEWVSNSTQVVGVFALAIGLASLVHMHGNKIKRQAPGWGFSIITLLCAVVVAVIGLVPKGCSVPLETSERVLVVETPLTNQVEQVQYVMFGYQPDVSYSNIIMNGKQTTWALRRNPLFDWVYNFMFFPLTATTFSLLAFYMITATYRAVRVKSWEAGILLFAAIVVLIGQVPVEEIPLIGNFIVNNTREILFISFDLVLILLALRAYFSFRYITLGVFVSLFILTNVLWFVTPSEITFENLKALILQYPNTAAKRGIIIGIALGGLATGVKIIFGIEKPYMGGRSS
jgi:hypothetical protein